MPNFRFTPITLNNVGNRDAIAVAGWCRAATIVERDQEGPVAKYRISDTPAGAAYLQLAPGRPYPFAPKSGKAYLPGEVIAYGETVDLASGDFILIEEY